MPNGSNDKRVEYNAEWCRHQHEDVNEKINLLFENLGKVSDSYITGMHKIGDEHVKRVDRLEEKVTNRINKIDDKYNTIITLLFANLAGVSATVITIIITVVIFFSNGGS